jgi:hypothetical protein
MVELGVFYAWIYNWIIVLKTAETTVFTFHSLINTTVYPCHNLILGVFFSGRKKNCLHLERTALRLIVTPNWSVAGGDRQICHDVQLRRVWRHIWTMCILQWLIPLPSKMSKLSALNFQVCFQNTSNWRYIFVFFSFLRVKRMFIIYIKKKILSIFWNCNG